MFVREQVLMGIPILRGRDFSFVTGDDNEEDTSRYDSSKMRVCIMCG